MVYHRQCITAEKTYVPKYIFTLSKVTSSCVNMLFSLGAMLIVLLVCRVSFKLVYAFIPVIIFTGICIYVRGTWFVFVAGNRVFQRCSVYIMQLYDGMDVS